MHRGTWLDALTFVLMIVGVLSLLRPLREHLASQRNVRCSPMPASPGGTDEADRVSPRVVSRKAERAAAVRSSCTVAAFLVFGSAKFAYGGQWLAATEAALLAVAVIALLHLANIGSFAN